jgi:biopolymer transport protein ExbD
MAFNNNFDDDIMSEINMTPLVDVMLVLLIIFMITVPVLTQSVPVSLPKESGQPIEPKTDTIVISITKDKEVFWQETSVSTNELNVLLSNIAAQNPQPNIHIKGDSKVPYEHVIKVMAAVSNSGMSNMGFITEPINE